MEYPIKYPKIQTLFMRDRIRKVKRKGLIMRNRFSKPEFSNIINWNVSEKLDGENTRIHIHYFRDNFQDGNGPYQQKVWLGGRGNNAQMNQTILKELNNTFNPEKPELMNDTFWLDEKPPTNIMLFGEAIGEGIHHGGLYTKYPTFVLFDVFIDGWWLDRENVNDIATKLGFYFAPSFGTMRIPEIIKFVKSKPNSHITPHKKIIEGVVCRPVTGMLYRNGSQIMFKLKCKDYDDIEQYRKDNGE